jgi:Protein of unknown function (DUF1302)
MGRRSGRVGMRAAAAAVAAALCGSALAFEFDTGSPDLSIRWDNTVRYNLGFRVDNRDSKIGNSAVSDEGTYSFDKGDVVTNRIDLLSELDVVWKKQFGFRVSGAGWYDGAYDSDSQSNPNPPLVNIPSYVNRKYSPYTKRYYHGPSAEWLDAFVFGKFDLGDVPTSVKAGRHSLYWGESLFVNGNIHGIAYAQNPLDLQKGFATPGSEAKELFRPLAQISGQAQVTDTVSVAAQYFFQWEEFRYPEGGTYTGPVDFTFNGPDRQFLSAPLGFAARGSAIEPDQRGEWGVSTRWSPHWLDGTLGFYYRNFADKLPQVLLTQVGPNRSVYNMVYKDDIDLFGISLAKNIGGVSLGTELSYRHNTPLNAQVLGNAAAAAPIAPGTTPGPVGDTYHGLVNVLGIIPKTPVFDTANWAAEVTWAHWSKVSSGGDLFNALGYAPCNGRDKWDGCTTKNYFGLALAFTPTWFQVFPGVDLSAPVTFATGLSGNAPIIFGGNEDNGNYTIGIGADIYQKYRVDLKYIDWFGRYKDNGNAVTTQNGFTTLLSDRGFISLTLKTTF